MSAAFPPSEPIDHGRLETSDGNSVYWEIRGNPEGAPAVVVHGGPGAPSKGMYRLLDPTAYRIVGIDQRNCGRSTPSAADPATDISRNTTASLIGDMEVVRGLLEIDQWLVFGASWGTTLALAYAQQHPDRVSAMVLLAVCTTTRREVEWITRDMGRIWPEAWERFRDGVPEDDRNGNLAAAYHRLLESPDAAVRQAAARNWCAWEDVHVSLDPYWRPNPDFEDPVYRATFARLVTHYWANNGFLPDGKLVENVSRLAGIPAVLITGRHDVSGPADIAWALHQNWPGSELVIGEDGGHGSGTDARVALDNAFARFAAFRR